MIDRRVRSGGVFSRPIPHEIIPGIGDVNFALLDGRVPLHVDVTSGHASIAYPNGVAMLFPEVRSTGPTMSVWVEGVCVGSVSDADASRYARKVAKLQDRAARPVAVRYDATGDGRAVTLTLRMPSEQVL